jgi:hypothetical protein
MADKTTHPDTPFTNVSSRLYQIAGKDLKPGDTVHIPGEHVEAVRKAPAVKSKDLVEGKANMPAPRPIQKPATLPDDMAKALAYVKVEEELSTLHAWAAAESGGLKRPEVMTAVADRAKALAGK